MKVGDYVRTENGLDKVADYRYEPEYENGHVVWFEKSNNGCRFTDKDLPKSSPNIIDLIEVGDYVNGNKIVHIQEKEFPNYPKRLLFAGVDENNIDDVWEVYNNEDIKSIVTKEQFLQMEYKL